MARPEPMNATPHHSKAKVSLHFSDPLFIAGQHVTGKMEFECRAAKGLGINVIKVELFAIQELTSRDHSATSTFLHLTQYFQGPGLPPSNAVYPHPLPGDDPPPVDHYPARKGTTTFFFRFQIPSSTPSSIDFGKGLAKLKYEVRASVGVAWRSERQFVMERKEIDVVEAPGEPSGGSEQVIVGENGKVWVQGRMLNPYVVAGQSACIELYVKNHSTKKTTGLSVGLMRHLHLPTVVHPTSALQISDTLLTMPFRGPDYVVHPGTEGIANLVFDIPKLARGVRSGRLDSGDEDDPREMESLFNVQCVLDVKLGMGLGSKDIILELPVSIIHPAAMKAVTSPNRYVSPAPYGRVISPSPYSYAGYSPPYYPAYISPPVSPPLSAHPWTPPPPHVMQPMHTSYDQYYYYPPPPPVVPQTAYSVRPSSADPFVAQQLPALPVHPPPSNIYEETPEETEIGKGERASRITAHLRMSSRNRSVSPQSRRFPVPVMALPSDSPGRAGDISARRSLPIHIPAADPNQNQNLLSASPRSNAEVLSPRPILSPKHSFTVDRGTVKSDRVIDLERMAAEEVAAEALSEAKGEKIDKPLPIIQPTRDDDTPETPKLPPQPTLSPITTRPRPEIWGRESGLELLERKLFEQVGTQRPEGDRRSDVRTVLPIAIPLPNDPRCDPPNDSAISSLALGADALKATEWPFGTPPKVTNITPLPVPSPPFPPNLRNNPKTPAEQERKCQFQGREKRSEVHQLRKAATGRVTAWLGGIDPAAPPPTSETPLASSPKTPAEDISRVDHDPHPLLRSPPIALPTSNMQDDTVPTRSSGFILHAARDASSFESPEAAHGEAFRASTPTQLNALAKEFIPSSTSMKNNLPQKPALQRYTQLAANPQPSDIRYDVRSARGGRGGKVASVTALWASLGTQQERTSAAQTPEGGRSSSRDFKAQHIPSPIARYQQSPLTHNPPLHSREDGPRNVNTADLANRRARIAKSTSVPAIVSSSLATPVLSSTASLARPLPLTSPKKIYPMASSNSTPTTDLSPEQTPSTTNATKSPTNGDLVFGQARLKDLIKKYQQGFGQ